MRARRTSLTVAAVLAVLAGLATTSPAVAPADSGPSAGDNQYVDPLSGTPTTTTKANTATATTPVTTPATTAPTSSTPTTTTAAAAPTATTPADPPGSLPHTGYDAWLIAGLGAGLAGAGVSLRRRVHAE